jgi:hypothetical protein
MVASIHLNVVAEFLAFLLHILGSWVQNLDWSLAILTKVFLVLLSVSRQMPG